MSKRSRTTLTLSVRMPLPPGATQAQALQFAREALENYKKIAALRPPLTLMSGLQSNEVLVKISHRETIYL